jgi:ABC-2 type transport system ATP-binding protein
MIEVRNVSKAFNSDSRTVQALDDVSFVVPDGEIVGFVGANGAGKTTCMRIIVGVLVGDSGEILYNGTPIDAEVRRSIGYMPSERGLWAKDKVFPQLQYLAELHGLTSSDAAQEVEKWLTELDVIQYKDAKLQTLSTGNAQRVQLASALVSRPKMLILDEPFSGLDPIAVMNMSETIRKMTESGVSVLFSSHQLELIDELCDKVLIIQAGKIVQDGTPSELREKAGAPPTVMIPTPLANIFKELIS